MLNEDQAGVLSALIVVLGGFVVFVLFLNDLQGMGRRDLFMEEQGYTWDVKSKSYLLTKELNKFKKDLEDLGLKVVEEGN